MRSDSDAHASTQAAVAARTEASGKLVGQLVGGGRYRVVAKIGRGGMGSIYEAEHVTTGKRFALKTLLPGLDRVEEIARRFEREARASSVLNHPNVISVTDFGQLEDGSLYLAMELVRGRPLGDLLDDGPLEEARAYRIARQVMEALAHAHGHGIIHRDLKPDNIMVADTGLEDDERDRVKLLDFGIAKVVGEAEAQLGGDKLTQAGIAFGTPDYMAPEQALGDTVDARADLYAMGVILFEMLCGRKPFVSDDKMAVMRMQVAVPPPTLSEAAPPGRAFVKELEDFVAKALEKRRDDRWTSAEEMLEAFDLAVAAQTRPLVSAVAEPVSADTATSPVPSLTDLTNPRRARRETEVTVSLADRIRPYLTPRNLKIGGASLGVFLVLILISLASGGGSKRPSIAAVPAAPRLVKTERAVRAEAMLREGKTEEAITYLEEEVGRPDGARDATAFLVLGHARAKLDRDVEALTAYEHALGLEPEIADKRLRDNAEAMLGRKDKSVPLVALGVLARAGELGHAAVVETASRGKTVALRKKAREHAEKLGLGDRVDLVSSYSLDLAQGGSCKERREVIPKLRALKDKKAIPALEKARRRSGGFLGLQDVNDCLDADAKEAIEFLQALR